MLIGMIVDDKAACTSARDRAVPSCPAATQPPKSTKQTATSSGNLKATEEPSAESQTGPQVWLQTQHKGIALP